MSRRQVLVLGTSHTKALADALAERTPSSDVEIAVHWLQSKKADRVVGDLPFETALERAAALGPDDVLAVAVHGTLHNVYGLLVHDQPFWIAPGSDEAAEATPEGSTLIPQRVLVAWMQSMSTGHKRVDALFRQCRARRFHLMTPPPKADAAFIMARTQKYRERTLDAFTIAPARQRLRLWACERRALAAALEPAGAQLLDPPPAALTADGFLDRAFYASDATHANGAYGGLVLDQLVRLATTAACEEPR